MSFPPGTEMFQFPGFASRAYGFSAGYRRSGGLPHSEIHGSMPARGSPWLIATCYVLHRLSVPRHPPDALQTLDLGFAPRAGENLHTAATQREKLINVQPSPVTRTRRREGADAGCGGELRPGRCASPPLGAVRAGRPAGRSSVTNRFHDVLDPAAPSDAAIPPGRCRVETCSLPADTCCVSASRDPRARLAPGGGGGRDRTDDLMLAKHALSQLSYAPFRRKAGGPGRI